jgi:putative chitinase
MGLRPLSLEKIMITQLQLKQILPLCKEPVIWVDVLNELLPEFGIEYSDQVAMFIAQCGHESSQFNVLEENLNYSGRRLLQVFPKYFNEAQVSVFANKPEKIANVIYSNRMGNTNQGDGWKYRGRGVIQLTGKTNYRNASNSLFETDFLLENPEAASEDKRTAMLTALWFWEDRELGEVTDIKKATRIINGGYNGIEERQKLYNKALSVLESQ